MGLQFCIMKFLFSVITFLFFSLVVSSVAQIGEPRSYFLSKFGQPNGSIEPRLVESVGKAELFKHDKTGIEFIVEYDNKDNDCVIISDCKLSCVSIHAEPLTRFHVSLRC